VARRPVVVDASVAVKWFSAVGEPHVPQAVDIMTRHVRGELNLAAPDLLYYEVANALVRKTALSDAKVRLSLRDLFALGLETVATSADLMAVSIKLARRLNITIYDACYAALAQQQGCPLVTANPRHQSGALGCEVIPLDKWR